MAQIDLNGLKTAIKSILDTANTTTGSPIDLSQNLNDRVQQVLKVHPGRISIQASFYPYITMFIDDKAIELASIARNQVSAKRLAELEINIVGAVSENIITSVNADDADEEIEALMENIEEVLRSNDTVNSTVKWAKPTRVNYHGAAFDEESIIRAATMTFNATVEY